MGSKYSIKALLLFVVGFMMIFTMPCSQATDLHALNRLYTALGSPGDTLWSWNFTGAGPCAQQWQGVHCDNRTITAIVLKGLNLEGQLDEELTEFDSLETLDLSNNHINGTIPENLPRSLRRFDVSSNQFTGSIPSSLSQLTHLSEFSVSNNSLDGDLPDAFHSLSRLLHLDLSFNNLTGQLPPSMESLSSLKTLHMQNNNLSGTLKVLKSLPLTDLNAENNRFSGVMPAEFQSISKLRKDGSQLSPIASPPTSALAPLAAPMASSDASVPTTHIPSIHNSGSQGKNKSSPVAPPPTSALAPLAAPMASSDAPVPTTHIPSIQVPSIHNSGGQGKNKRSPSAPPPTSALAPLAAPRASSDAPVPTTQIPSIEIPSIHNSGSEGKNKSSPIAPPSTSALPPLAAPMASSDASVPTTQIPSIHNSGSEGKNKSSPIAPPPTSALPPLAAPIYMASSDASVPTTQIPSIEVPSIHNNGSEGKNKSSRATLWTIGYYAAIAVASILVVLLVVLGISKLQKAKRNKRPNDDSTEDGAYVIDITRIGKLPGQPLTEKVVAKPIISTKRTERSHIEETYVATFSVATLQQYTNSFREENLICEGRLGKVYLAQLSEGKSLTVLMLDSMAANIPVDDFLDLVLRVSKLRHIPNILNLVGYCVEFGQRLLVYDYFSKRTLHDVLHCGDDLRKRLSWDSRIQVALGAARALEYLHDGCQPPVVYKNFESANVLLDDELAVQVSECGLGSLMSSNFVTPSSGYEAPEISESGSYTIQSDVYSFGVLMLELLTGCKPYDSSKPLEERHLARWASSRLQDLYALLGIMDLSIDGNFPMTSLSWFADVICQCIQVEPELRPPMSKIVQDLTRIIEESKT